MANLSEIDQSVKVVSGEGKATDYLVSLLNALIDRATNQETIAENTTNDELVTMLLARIANLEKRVAALEP